MQISVSTAASYLGANFRLGKRRLQVHSVRPYSREAYDYFGRLDDVDARIQRFDRANAYVIDASKDAGSPYWDTMGTFTTLCAKGYAGLTIPLRDGMDVGTGVNLSSGNYNAVTGYVGDGSTMYIDSGRNNNADGQNDASRGVWISTPNSSTFLYLGAGATDAGTDGILTNATRSRSTSASAHTAPTAGFAGISRAASTGYDYRKSGATTAITQASQTPFDGNIFIGARNESGTPAGQLDGRLAVYHIGPAITLATMDTILTEFMARVAAA